MGNGGESGTWHIGHSNLDNFAKYIILSNFGGHKGGSKIVNNSPIGQIAYKVLQEKKKVILISKSF